jgi:hypothetical protein
MVEGDQTNFWEQQWFLDHVTSDCGPIEPLAAHITAEHVRQLYNSTLRWANIASGDNIIEDTAPPCLAPPTLDTHQLLTSVAELLPHASSEHLLIVTQRLVHHFQQQQERTEFPVPSSAQQQLSTVADQPPQGGSTAAAATSNASSSQPSSSAAATDDLRRLTHAEAAQVLVRLLAEPAAAAKQFEDQAGAAAHSYS